MKAVITLEMNGTKKRIQAEHGALLSDVLSRFSGHVDMPCAGRGVCGQCVVYVDGLKCLACQTTVQGNISVRLIHSPLDFNRFNAVNRIAPRPAASMFRHYGVAIDIGTTTVCAALVDASGLTDTLVRKNPQTAFGADVISRMERALAGHHAELTGCIRTTLNEMISELCKRRHISSDCIDAAVITGNTTMLYLLTGDDLEPLSRAPFYAGRLFGETLRAQTLGLSLAPNARIYIPPCISAFVGADITTAVVAGGLCDQHTTALLADIGTNGEIALWHDGMLTCCSTAAGPAFEGMGISHGMHGINGAIDHAWLDGGQIQISTIGGGPAIGICGSGIIDILAVMLELGIVNHTGAFENGRDYFSLQNGIQITAADVRNIQLAKGSLRAGIETLLETAGVCKKEIALFSLSGHFGNFIHLDHAAAIGLIPADLLGCANTVGNAAHAGAIMLLCDQALCAAAQSIAKHSHIIALDANAVFTDNYMKYMLFE